MAKKLSPDEQAIISAFDAGYFATTVELAQRLLKNQPDNLRILVDYGHACRQLGRYQEADDALQKAIEVCDPDKADVIFGELGNLKREQGLFDQAEEWFQKQVDTDPRDATGYLFWGTMLLRRGELESAAEILGRGLECKLGCLEELHYTLGLALRGMQDYRSAVAQFQKASDMDRDYTAAKIALKDAQSAAAASE